MKALKQSLMLASLALPVLSACITSSSAPTAYPLSEVAISITVPDAAWEVEIVAAHRIAQEVWVLSVLKRDDTAIGAQVITTVEDSARIQTGAAEIRHFVVGRTFEWESKEPYTFLRTVDDYYRMLPANAIKIYDRSA